MNSSDLSRHGSETIHTKAIVDMSRERGFGSCSVWEGGGDDSLVRKTGLPGWVEVGGNYTD